MENPAPKILVLDDDDCRHDQFRLWLSNRGCEATHVHTATQAIELLKSEPVFDLICLDHDLDLIPNGNNVGEFEETGMMVAEFVNLHMEREKLPRKAMVHSWNAPAAKLMAELLADVEIPVVRIPFGLTLIRHLPFRYDNRRTP